MPISRGLNLLFTVRIVYVTLNTCDLLFYFKQTQVYFDCDLLLLLLPYTAYCNAVETALPGWLEWGLKEEEDTSKCSLQRSYMRTQQKKNRDNRSNVPLDVLLYL